MALGCADFVAWARSLPATGAEADAYRQPAFEGARAPSKAEAAARELQDARDALTKAVVRAGEEGGGSPRAEGDVVMCHLSLRCADEEERLLFSTRVEEGGRGVPLRSPLGEGCTLLRGCELALAAFTRGERAVLRLPPHFAYGHACCAARALSPPRPLLAKHAVFAELELLDFHAAKVVCFQGGLVTKRLLKEGRGLETPHAPYEVVLHVSASLPAVWEGAGTVCPPAPALLAGREVRCALGAGELPPCLEAAVSCMRPGERAAFWCAPACALRPAASLPELPECAADGVEWVVELQSMVQVRDLYGDGSLLKRRLQPGSGDFPVDCPIHDCTVRVHVTTHALAPARALMYDSRAAAGAPPLQFELATGAQPPGLEACIRLMVPGEVAVVVAAAAHAYDAQPRGSWPTPPALAPGSAVEWEVTLLGFDAPVNWHQAEGGEILGDALRAKEAGVQLFRAHSWALARARFEAVAAKLAGLRGLEAPEEGRAQELRCTCLLNAAAAAQRMGEHAQAAAHCSTVLHGLDAGSAKALYRRAVSRTALGLWAEAEEDLEAARAADPLAAPDCDRQLAKLRAEQRAEHAAQRAKQGFLLNAAAQL